MSAIKHLKLAIIILQHNTPHHVEENLHKLSQAVLPDHTEIIVVNNGGHQANQKVNPKSYSTLNISFHDIPNLGFPKSNNFGYSQLSQHKEFYDYVAFINPDIQVEANTLQEMLIYMQNNPKVALTSPALIYPNGKYQDNYRVFPKILDLIIKRIPTLRKIFTQRMQKYLMWDRNPTSTQAVDWVVGAFTLIRNEIFLNINQHDESYFLFMSDVVICRQIWQLGLQVHIIGSIKALHNDQRASSGGIQDIFRKKTLRIHIKDALIYFWNYKFTPIPPQSPSKNPKT